MKNVRYIVLGLLLSTTVSICARVFEAGDVIYVKQNPTNWSWYGDNVSDGKFAYFFKEGTSSHAWSEEATGVSYCDDVLQIKVPAGDWTHVIMTRNSVHSGPDWSNVYNNGDDNTVNKSADIKIPDNQNYLSNFRQYKDANDHPTDKWYWNDCYFFRPTENPTLASVSQIDKAKREIIEVCTQSSGDPLSLQPRLISPTSGYDYNQGRTWFKWDGSQWKELKHANGKWGFDGPGGLNETIGAADSHTYYFLSTKDHNKQRFIEISVTKDCSPTCEITDFGVVTSNVNAHDSTYVLDGIVAFKDATGKTLRISVTDAKGEHYVDYPSPTTPQIFSLPNLYADGATGVTAKAEFLGTPYSATTSFKAPDAITGISTTTINKAQGESTTLTPATPGTDGFVWHDGNTTDHDRIIPAYNFDTTIVYTYYEYENPPEVGGNLIKNGDFSSPTFDYGTPNYASDLIAPFSTISEYHYWGKDITTASDFYTLKGSITGGMAIVKDANSFWQRYTKKIDTKQGTHFALFDADNSGEKAAWIIETNATTQPDLKLAKGTNYMFSFWVANINNYGEMNNAAKLQFEISYSLDAGATWSTPEKLGNPIDLNDYMDNLWHQNSYVYVSTVDASKVRISVKDLNTNSNPGGNDFALDDIQFQPISVVSQAIKHCQRFVVNIFEPAVIVNKPDITITKTPACGKTDFEMQVTVSYSTLNNKYPVSLQLTDNIYGAIFSTPIPIDPSINPNSITLTLPTSTYAMLVADGNVHMLTATIIRKDGHNVDKGGLNSNTYTSPGIPAIKTPVLTEQNKACDKTTFDLQVATEYVAFKGTKLHYDWDGAEWTDAENPALSYKELTWQTAIGKLNNITADGKKHTLRVYSDNAALDCEYTINPVTAPYMPQITAATATLLPYGCGNTNYQIKVEATFANGQEHDLIIEDWNGNKQTIATAESDTKKEYTFAYAWETPATHEYKVYFSGAESCADNHKPSFTSPAEPRIENVAYNITSIMDCGNTTYDLSVTFDYYNQDGTLSVDVDGTPATGITPAFVANSTTKQSATATFMSLPADGNTHTITVKTSGGVHNCTADAIHYTAPTTPAMTISVFSPALADCATSASVTFDVAYTNQQGQMRYWIDNQPYVTKAISEKNTAPVTINGLTIPAFDADGKTHKIHVLFDGANSCEDSIAFTAPLSQAISSVAVTGVPDNILCGQTSYTATATITLPYENAVGKNIVLSFEGKDSTITISSNPYAALVPLSSIDTKGLSMTAHLSDAPPTCITPSNTYDAPTQLSCIKDMVDVCEGEYYKWPVTGVTYGPFNKIGINTISSTINIHDSLFVIVHPHPEIAIAPMDTLYEDITEIRLPYAVTSGTPNLFDVTVNGVTVSKKRSSVDTIVIAKPAGVTTGDYTVEVKVQDSLFTCYTTENKAIHIAGIPTINTLTVTPRVADCDATSYIADVHVNYMNARGNLIIEDKTGGNKYSYPVPAAPYNTPQTLDTTITLDSFTPAARNWEAYFTGWASVSTTSVAPVVPTADIVNVKPSDSVCAKTTCVSFSVDYVNQRGQLLYWVDTPPYIATTITENSTVKESTPNITVTNIAADGKQHMLHILFNGANSCEDSIPFTAALSQFIDSVVVSSVPASVLCDQTSYTANVAVYMPFDTTGKNITLTYEGTSTTIPVSGNPTTTTLTLTTVDAKGLTITANYSDATECIATSNYFDAPKRWSCDKDTAHICLNDSYTWHGNNLSPATAGTYDYTDNYDQLHLVVHDLPQVSLLSADIICDSENEIRLPFVVSRGTPNKLNITIGTHTFNVIPGTSDTIVLPRPTDIPAGTYTASVNVQDTLVTCNSQAQTTFIIAAGGLMYSKWTDLLFIDNSSNHFVEYQWFENGAELAGETQQRLYHPGGLSGTYFCRLTTTDSLTIYTCEQSFDEVTPSRTINGEDAQVTSTTVYDPMGRIIPGTPSNGIYIILEEVNGEKRARKIAIYE